ncbi:polysaccharide deacetylase family protein [Streptomyces sp. ISL-1]|uniref:polysaccharide deacetylase family protein n=1 Tax=Streptomyces sp. ISL-1 TaxID=2817657 RepID=UPI001BEB83BE|nr:polysaccharide deacetylase family protein [Streptomyces sp. ISL-1]MBT2388480.1 polysaccharide deacetylase family protein [Streptomyces sp. ISL-1]
MKKDQMLPGRRSVMRLGACLGAAATAGLLFTERAPTAAGTEAALPVGGPRAVAHRPVKASAYRLQPMTAISPPRFGRAMPPVRRQPILKMAEAGRTMVLTFDDGPDPRYTPDILSTLRKYQVPAMFFVCGEMAADNRDLICEMADDGHVVGNHTWSHPLIPKLPPSRIRDELSRTSEVIEETTGSPPLWYRAPFGAWNKHSFEIGAQLGMEPLAWTLDTRDWTEPGTKTIVRRVLNGAGPGVVVLSHDAGGDRSQSVAALRRYLPELLDAGYRITVPRR